MRTVANTSAGHPGSKGTLKERAISELEKYAVISAYLWVLFALFSLHRQLLQGHGISLWQQGFAIINALVFGKVILIGEALDLAKGGQREALVWVVCRKALVFSVLLVVFHLVEEAIRAWFGGQPLSTAVTGTGGSLAGVAAYAAIFFVTLIPFYAFQETARVLGGQAMWNLFSARAIRVIDNHRTGDGPQSGGFRGFGVGPLPRAIEAFRVAICDGSNTSTPAIRRAVGSHPSAWEPSVRFRPLDLPEPAARERPPVAADDHDLEFATPAGEDARGRPPGAIRDKGRQVEARGFRELESLEPAVGFSDRLGKGPRPSRIGDARGERGEIDSAALGMKVEHPLGELGHLRRSAGDGDARDRAEAQIFEQAADEVAHLDQRVIGQAVKPAQRAFGRLARRARRYGRKPAARATSTPRWIEWIQAAQE